METKETLGQFEQFVLAAVKNINNAYAVPILAHVEQVYGRPVKVASVYTTLNRLEEKGYITARMADATPQRGNMPKRYYTIAPLGQQALEESALRAARFLESVRANSCDPITAGAEPKH